jgi:hypothetical protein
MAMAAGRHVIRTLASVTVAAVVCSVCHEARAAQDGGVSVQASPTVTAEPGVVRLLIRLDRDEANRALVVEVDSPDLFRSSVISLDGASAPAVHSLHFRSLPAGEYDVTVRVYRDDRSASTARSSFVVAG